MITIVGCEEGPEVDAARAIRQAILKAWLWVDTDPGASVYLVPNVQCHGESPRDIDLVLLLSVPPDKAKFQPSSEVRLMNDAPVEADVVRVRSLCLVIEVKDHRPEDVRCEGTKVEVRYRSPHGGDHWHSATQQSERQKYSLRNYLAHHVPDGQVPHIVNLIWLRNVLRDSLPKGPHNILPATITWSGVLDTVAANMRVRSEKSGITLAATKPESTFSFSRACEVLCRRLAPTALDRRRMDRIAHAEIRDAWIEELGKRQVIFEGRGGTGKTVILLALAWRVQQQRSARALVLTYNRALVADLRRLLTLMGVGDEVGRPAVEVQTVHSFLFRLLTRLGVIGENEGDFLERYEHYKAEALALIRNEVLTPADLAKVIEGDPEQFGWDFIFVDEAQDWPADERDLLHALYPATHFVIADGKDQLVRSDSNCDWSRGTGAGSSRRFAFRRGLRMKSNLARFANAVADGLQLPTWSIEENPDAPGGRVIVVEGDYVASRKLHASVVQNARTAGNAPVDLLVCVPPSMVARVNGGRVAVPAATFREWGQDVWDGVSEDLRRTYPTSSEQLRIVQYDSCRGLEGWTVFNLLLDEFYEYKLAAWTRPPGADDGGPVDEGLLAQRFAARWTMIPVSRAIDTLVLNVRSRTTAVGRVLHDLAQRFGDFAEWVQV